MQKLFRLTKSGIDELTAEQEALKQKRVKVTEAVQTAREMGDLKENAEYQSARAEQENIDNRLSEIEHVLANVEVIAASRKKQIELGSRVTLKGKGGKQLQVQVVGTIEADPIAQKISDESPIGKALLGKKEGEEVEIVTPAETAVYTVASIS